MAINKLKASELYQRCDTDQFDFNTTAQVKPLLEVIGQKRAVDAVRFGVGIQRDGYNLYALGPNGIGKSSLVHRYVEEKAQSKDIPSDWCYVNNFQQPHKPHVLELPAGMGHELSIDMEQLIEDLHAVIPAVFESEEYRTRSQVIEEELSERQERAIDELRKAAREKGISLINTPTGITLAPTRNDEVMKIEDFKRLPKKEREKIEEDTELLQERLIKALHKAPQWQKEARDKVAALNREMSAYAAGNLVDAVREKYQELPALVEHLNQVEVDVVEHFRNFLRPEGEKPSFIESQLTGAEQTSDTRYRVNALVTRDTNAGAPVVYEDNPSYLNLIGRVEHRAYMGTLETDFTMIRAGALHQANGGYLILDALKVLMQPFAWEGLKRALQSQEIRMESLGQMTSLISTVSLEPEPVPLQVKLVLLGDRRIYYLLSYLDPEFSELFKVAVDFDDRMDRNTDSQQLYARLVGTMVHDEKLLEFDSDAVARVIEHSARIVSDADKLSTHMRSLQDLLSEADYWAREDNQEVVGRKDVQHAIDAADHRADRIRERVQEEIERGTLLIDTTGKKVGQVNGLSVIQLGNFSFGQPSRITARVRIGGNKVIDIEREVKLGGPIHSKGVLILSSYLGSHYSVDYPLSLTASLVFEQSYGEVEGDSASSAELYALISALSDIPVNQSLAVTGSVNQHGEIQPIGGVNEKIEGFFDVCSKRGLDGEQGVIIPASNSRHLMLRNDVCEAVEEGKFTVYTVETIDDGIELLTGMSAGQRDENGKFPADSINHLVQSKLTEYATKMHDYASHAESPGGKE
ncbi:MAG: AAA family ATPase [Arenicellales bacterium]|jgi:lon-related putative ATP-dependent protease